MQPLGQRAEQAGRDREIKGLHHIGAHHLGQFGPATLAHRVHRDIAQPRAKGGNAFGVTLGCGQKCLDRLDDLRDKGSAVLFGARSPDDTRIRRHLTVTKPPVKPGQDLAPRQITRSTENHKVELLDRDNTRNHFWLSTLAKSAPLALTDFRAPAIYAAAAQVQQKRRMRCHGCMAQSNSNITEAPNHAVMPPLSKGGETSTRSAPMISSLRRARTHWIASKLVGPPTSGVPVPGA